MISEGIHRYLWRAAVSTQNLPELIKALDTSKTRAQALLDAKKLMTISLFQWEQHLLLYYEAADNFKGCLPENLLKEASLYLESWPGEKSPRKWIPLIDVFHFNKPHGLEHWRRKSAIDSRIGQIGMLKPERVAYYLFYHYALQEGQVFLGDKFEIIGLSENLLFAYREHPEVIEMPPNPPTVSKNIVPENWADVGIPSCFIPWPDLPGVWLRPMDVLFSF